jgi:hypothetical protein
MNLSGYKTFLGAFITLLPVVARSFGFEFTESFGQEFPLALDEIVTLVGAAIVIYGRLKAQTPGWLVSK